MSFYDPNIQHPGVDQLATQEPPNIVLVPSPGTPVRLSATRRFYRSVELRGKRQNTKDDSADVNAGDVFIGRGDQPGQQMVTISPGGVYVLSDTDLSNWWLDSQQANDGLAIQPL